MHTNELSGIIAGQDRDGVYFDGDKVRDNVVKDLNEGSQLSRRSAAAKEDYEKASKTCEDAIKMFDTSIDRLCKAQEGISEKSKKVSGQIRKAANELAEGLIRVEKTANFDKLERYVALLERSAAALQLLADLDKDGKLEKIMNATK